MHDVDYPLSLREFLSALEERCRKASKEELVELILSIAEKASPENRREFMQSVMFKLNSKINEKEALHLDELPDFIETCVELKDDILDRIIFLADEPFGGEGGYGLGEYYDDEEVQFVEPEEMKVFGSLLYCIPDSAEKAYAINQIVSRWGKDTMQQVFLSMLPKSERKFNTLYEEIIMGLNHRRITDADKEEFRDWTREIGTKIITEVVSGQNRDFYRQAAIILGALAECAILNAEKSEAISLFDTFYKEKFRRHTAFRREVEEVVNNSYILKNDIDF